MKLHDTLLNDYNVMATDELDEARAAVSQRYCDHKLLLRSGRKVNARHNHVRGAHVSLNVLGYGAEVAVDPGELQKFYLLQIPLVRSAQVSHRGEEFASNPASGSILNPDRPTNMVWHAGCRKLMVQIDADYLERVAKEEVIGTLPGPLRFDPRVDLAGLKGQRLRSLAVAAARALDNGQLKATPQDLTLLAMERHLAVTLLETQHSNLSHLFATRQGVTAGPVRKAVAYINATYYDLISLADIAKAAGVHHRTLQTAFRQSLGVTPIQYLRDVRLDMARFHLLRRQNRAKVSEIAYDCGYSHLGRFSRDFRARFGHAPSETNQPVNKSREDSGCGLPDKRPGQRAV